MADEFQRRNPYVYADIIDSLKRWQMAVVTSTSTTYMPYSQECLYTLTAVKQGEIYIVDGFRQPSFDCL